MVTASFVVNSGALRAYSCPKALSPAYMFCGLLASGLHRVLEFDGAHLGLPVSRVALYAGRKTIKWTCACFFGQGRLSWPNKIRRGAQQDGSRRHRSDR